MALMKITELTDVVYDFCAMYSGIKLFLYQEQFSKRLIRSLLENDGEELTALFARQIGKSETVAVTVGGVMIFLPHLATLPMFADDKRIQRFADGVWVGIFAPSLRQSQITFNRIRARLQSKTCKRILLDPEFALYFTTSNGQTCSLSNGSWATSLSASENSNIEGESLKLIIIEEAQDVSDFKIKKSIMPMGAFYNASIAKIGTSSTYKGDFFNSIDRNKKFFENGQLHLKNHYEFDYKIGCKYNPSYAKYIEGEKFRYGEHSDEFRMSYKLEWLFERGSFIDDVLRYERDNGDPTKELEDYNRLDSHVVGIDIAAKTDSTVITVVKVDWENPVIDESRYNEETNETEIFKAYYTDIVCWKEIFGEDYESQYHICMDFFKNFNIVRLVIDSTKEASLADRFKANVPFEVIPFVFSSQSKSDMYKYLDGEIKSKRAMFPRGEMTVDTREYTQFLSQMGDLQKNYKGALMQVCHPPNRGAHDDYSDSYALAVYGTKDQTDTVVVETEKENIIMKKKKSMFYSSRNKITAKRR